VSACKSDIVDVDMKRVQSNIIMLKIDPEVMSASQFCERMRRVSRRVIPSEGDILLTITWLLFPVLVVVV
jgi:hypothetical protein